jgi:hypothetical protein
LFSASPADAGERFKFGTDPEIKHIRPEKPVRVKVKRNAKGTYSWDITGDNVDEVIEADRKLREYMKIE